MKTTRMVLIAFAAVLSLPVTIVRAGTSDQSAKDEVHKLWNVDAMIKQAAKNIGDRYNLNGEQRKQTAAMLSEEVGQFLDTHPEIWPLIRDLTRLQLEGKAPEGEVARRLGDAALPLLEEMREAIVNGNMRWRTILTDEQKAMHDYDLKDIDRQFNKMNENFNAMAKGQAKEVQLFPPPTRDPAQPARPPRPNRNYKPQPPPSHSEPQEDWWDGYVRNFIRKYDLDDAQSEAAWSILRECKERAASYKKSKAREFAKAADRLKQARDPKLPPEVQRVKTRLWRQEDKALKKPILDIFHELQKRLDKIPRDAQRKHVEAAAAHTATRKTKP